MTKKSNENPKFQRTPLVTSNDAVWVEDRQRPNRLKNPHLEAKTRQGARAHAQWEKEHPNLSAWGKVLGAVPLAVAAAPFAVTAGDAAASSAAGQAVTAGLTSVASLPAV